MSTIIEKVNDDIFASDELAKSMPKFEFPKTEKNSACQKIWKVMLKIVADWI